MSGEAVKLEKLLRSLRGGLPLETSSPPLEAPLYAGLRRGGRLTEELWIDGGGLPAALSTLLRLAEAHRADGADLCLTHDWRTLPPSLATSLLTNRMRGVLGVQYSCRDARLRVAPTRAIASNRSFAAWQTRFLESYGVDIADFLANGRIEAFGATQALVRLDGAPAVEMLHRGGQLVAPEALDRAELEHLTDGMVAWMRNHLRGDGRLTYKYWPSRGRESKADNPIRRFMATLALVRTAEVAGDPELLAAASRNLDHNLGRFYRQDGVFGLIEWKQTVKLGAIALAGLAILEHPERDRWHDVYVKLSRTVDHLHQENGRFRTFLQPAARSDQQNFYPGEALLFWARRLHLDRAEDLPARFRASFHHYRAWHRSARNPAFVPWHSMAYALAAPLLCDTALRSFVFEMNDWLLPMQQWGHPLPLDLWGRFYEPQRPDFGPPHASSTGVYLEGLAAALGLAQQAGDQRRASAYELAIWRAARSLRQLQFRSTTETYYLAHPSRVLGGLRSEVYDNTLRVDSVQHGLMGLLAARPLLRRRDLQEATAAAAAAAPRIDAAGRLAL